MFRKNVAGQFIHFQGVDSSTGGIKSGVTWTVRRCIDGTFGAGGGTVTEDGSTGWYKYAMSQADTNGNNIAFNFTGTGAIPQTVNIVTTAGDPTDATRFGLTALPNANAEAAGGLYTRGTGAGQINQPANGQVDANAVKVGGTTQTGRDIGASVLLSSGTGSGQLDFTSGVVKANLAQIIGTVLTETPGLIAAGFKKFFNVASPTGTVNSLPDAIPDASGGLPVTGTRLTAIPTLPAALVGGRIDASVGAYQSGQAPLQPTTAGRTLDVSAGGEAGVDWANVGSPSTTVGLSGTTVKTATDVENDTQDIQSRLPAALDANGFIKSDVEDWKGSTAPAMSGDSFARLGAPAGASISADVAAVKSDTGAIKAKTDNLPSDPADASDVAGAFSTVNGTLATVASYIDTEVGAIKAKTDNLPASPAATGDIPSASDNATAVWEASVAGLTTTGSVGKRVVDNLNAAVGSRLAPSVSGRALNVTPAGEVYAKILKHLFTFPSTGILDNFNRSDEGPPPSANWTSGVASGFDGFAEPGFAVESNQLFNIGNDVAQQYWNAEEFGPDCEAYITLANSPDLRSMALLARLTNIGEFTTNGYAAHVNFSDVDGGTNNYQIYRITGGLITLLISRIEPVEDTPVAGHQYGIRIIGDDIQFWADTGNGWELKINVADSTYRAGGFIGINTESNINSRQDNFGGGSAVLPADDVSLGNIADAVWDEEIVSEHQTDDTAGKKLSQALILYEGS